MFDIKEWLDPHSDDLHKHVRPHCFKFVKNNKGEAVMYYRKWSGDDWMGPVRLLKVKRQMEKGKCLCAKIWNNRCHVHKSTQ